MNRTVGRLKFVCGMVGSQMICKLHQTTFSRIFDRNGRFETRLQFFIWLGSRREFLSSGMRTAVLKSDGTSPDRIDLHMMFVRAGRRGLIF